jgi:hypothetical protein
MKRNDIVFFLVSTMIVAIAWIIFTVIHQSQSTISDSVAQQIAPIAGSFDMQTIEQIKDRTQVSPLISTISAVPTALPTQTITPPARIAPQSSQTATGGAQ